MGSRIADVLGLIFALSEVALGLSKRAAAGEARVADRGSLWQLWVIIVISVNAAYWLPSLAPALDFGPAAPVDAAGAALFTAGLALRWYSIVHLGRFFTVNVAIASDHRLVDTGPYRYVRHPSYTGALMAFVGLGLCLRNWASLAALCIPVSLVFLRRMHVEEAALRDGLGEVYRDYMRRTKRLIPSVY